MDSELLELLRRLAGEGDPLSDDDLARVAEEVAAVAAGINAADPTDDDIAVLTEARDAIVAVRAEQASRAAARDERAAAAAALLAELHPPEVPAVEEEAPPAETEAEAPAPETADPPAVEDPAVEPVAAAADPPEIPAAPVAPAAPASRVPSISHLAHRGRPARPSVPLVASADRNPAALIAAADIPGVAAGSEVDVEEWATGCARRIEAIRLGRNPGADGEQVYFGSVRRAYPEERTLDGDTAGNERKIEAVSGPKALAAAGGICSPVAVDYSLAGISSAVRPVRDQALVPFAATRGGVRYVLPHTLAQVTAAGPASLWTEANDANPVSPSTKPHAVFTCQGVQEAYVDAVTSIAQFGNFQSRYFPEQIAQFLQEVDAVHARLAEATLLKAVYDGSTAVTAGNYDVGAAREVLAIVDRAAAAFRYRHRMTEDSPLRVLYPEWLEDMIREDLAKNLPGDSGGQAERLAVADGQIDAFFRVRNVNVTTTLDSPTSAATLQGFGVQGAGQLVPWPLHTIIWLYHEGAWMFLDGGELNLGMVRDSVLNATNDYQMFSESFEKAIFRGHESLAITCAIAPTGATVGTEAPTAVTPGLGS